MGIIRGGLLTIVSVLLFFSIFAGALLFTISWSLNYENVQSELGPIVKDLVREEVGVERAVVDNFLDMQTYCVNHSDYVLSHEGETIVIPCFVVFQGQEAVINHSIGDFVYRIYFNQYECGFWNCLTEQEVPFFLVSSKAQQYWYSKFNYALIIIAVLSVLGFLLAEKKSNFFILISFLIILAALPFTKVEWFATLFGDIAEGILSVFLSKSYAVFLRLAALGVVLLVIGVVLKFFRIGFKIQSIFAKDKVSKEEVKDIVKKEVSKDKAKTQVKKKPFKKKKSK
ncbi:MAG: hypothetical protein ABIH59_02750 [archaeon]